MTVVTARAPMTPRRTDHLPIPPLPDGSGRKTQADVPPHRTPDSRARPTQPVRQPGRQFQAVQSGTWLAPTIWSAGATLLCVPGQPALHGTQVADDHSESPLRQAADQGEADLGKAETSSHPTFEPRPQLRAEHAPRTTPQRGPTKCGLHETLSKCGSCTRITCLHASGHRD